MSDFPDSRGMGSGVYRIRLKSKGPAGFGRWPGGLGLAGETGDGELER